MQRREARQPGWKRRSDRDGQKIRRSKGRAEDQVLEGRYARGQDHDGVVPVPLIYGYGYPRVRPSFPGFFAAVGPFLPVHSVYLRIDVDTFGVYPDVLETMVH